MLHRCTISFKALSNNDKPVYRQPTKLNPENVLYVETDTDLIHQANSKKINSNFTIWCQGKMQPVQQIHFLLTKHS